MATTEELQGKIDELEAKLKAAIQSASEALEDRENWAKDRAALKAKIALLEKENRELKKECLDYLGKNSKLRDTVGDYEQALLDKQQKVEQLERALKKAQDEHKAYVDKVTKGAAE